MNHAMTGAPTPAGSADWSGSEAAYAASYRDLLRVAYVLTGSSAAAEDVVHDVFCKVGPRISSLENPPAYLHVAVVNQCRSMHRRFTRAPRATVPSDEHLDTGLTEFREALQTLPIKQRTAVVLRYLCDLPDDQIADILDCRPTTVRTLVHRGLAQLRTRIS
ncbi:MAG: polymerase, sigma-24 subunit, subfamily [Ilumatobacteraceae bacterium]|nr:polymerase, sigma-24 subunit, subfamily [Ilumatobacteraceae bacterium]